MAKVLLKKSSVVSNVPTTSDLDYGEVAINFADGKLYYKNSSNEIKSFNDADLVDSDLTVALTDYLALSGGTMTGVINMDGQSISNVATPTLSGDAVNKQYVDDTVASGVADINYPTGDYGRVDSDAPLDAFGVYIALTTYDHMTPSGSLATVDHGSL